MRARRIGILTCWWLACAVLTSTVFVAVRVDSRASLSGHPAVPLASVAVPWPEQGQAALSVEGVGSLGSSGVRRPVPIASLAKVMTAYLVLRAHPAGAGFTVTIQDADVADWRRRAANDESVVPVATGEVLDEEQLLDALLLPSANNIAALLAVHDSGSIEAFVA